MPKYVVKPNGKYMLIDPISGEEVRHEGYTLVTVTSFIQSRIAGGQVSVESPEFPDAATDEEFQGYLKDSEGNADLAISSYLSRFKPVEMREPSPEKSDGDPGGEDGEPDGEEPNRELNGEHSTESRRRQGRSRR